MDTNEIINNMIDKIIAGDNVDAKQDFEALISTRLQDALDVKKQEVAASIYSNPTDSAAVQQEYEQEEIIDDEQDTEEA